MFDLHSLCADRIQPHWLSTVQYFVFDCTEKCKYLQNSSSDNEQHCLANSIQLEHTAKSIEYLWNKRIQHTYPKSNIQLDSSQPLYADVNGAADNVYITREKTESIIRYNDLLPPLRRNGEIHQIPAHNLSTFQPTNYSAFKMELIQIHIQFSDKSYDVIQQTLQKTSSHRKYLQYKRKRQRLKELSKSDTNIRQSQRVRNRLHREIAEFDHSLHHHSNRNRHVQSNGVYHSHKSKKSKQHKSSSALFCSSNSTTPNTSNISNAILNLPALEPNTNTNSQPNTNKTPRRISEDSVSSMSMTPDLNQLQNGSNPKKRKLDALNNGMQSAPNKKRKTLKIIDNDVIGDSDSEEDDIHEVHELSGADDDEKEEFAISHSFVYEVSLDDLKLAFFLRLFPQLYITHHLIYCQNSYQHYYYQNYFSSEHNKYEWIQTDVQLMDIYHRYIAKHFVSQSMDYNIKTRDKYNDFKKRKMALFFQIRPRSDTQSTEANIQYHQQLLLENLMKINELQKGFTDDDEDDDDDEEEDEALDHVFYMNRMDDTDAEDESDTDQDQEMQQKYKSIYLNSSQDELVSNVLEAISQNEQRNKHEFEEAEEKEIERESRDERVNGNGSHNEQGDGEQQKTMKEKALIPGTWESGLCGFCERVNGNDNHEQRWIECDFCNKWMHVACSGIDMDTFLKHQNDDKHEQKYKCLMCNEL